jgi:2-polyprenyl-3-methyl-5-hydroxy-6-metoxy-1,4-benzoquinol methylase
MPIGDQARAETIRYHESYYSQHSLFDQDSWLKAPDQYLLALAERQAPLWRKLTGQANSRPLRIADLGAGVGRNAIPLARFLKEQSIPAQIDCLDLLSLSIDKLEQYAEKYGVSNYINGIVQDNDDFQPTTEYDLIIAISTLEHCSSKASLQALLQRLEKALAPQGHLIVEITTDRQVRAVEDNSAVDTFVETPLERDEVEALFQTTLASLELVLEENFPYQEQIELNGRQVFWSSCQTSKIFKKRA